MSERKRTIAGAPERPASEAAGVIIHMVEQTLVPADVDDTVVARELETASAAIRMLIAGKHLSDAPLVLVADPLRLEIRVATGDAALSVSEKLGKVPGAATAETWRLHLPSPQPIAQWVGEAVRGLRHVTTDAPTKTAPAALTKIAVDAAALRRVAREAS